MDAVIQPTQVPPQNYIAAQIVLDLILGSVVAIRIATNYHHHKQLFADDYLSFVALIFVAVFSATSSIFNATFFRKPEEVTVSFLTDLAAATISTSTVAMYFSKLPLLFFLLRIFRIEKLLRYTIHAIFFITTVGFSGAALYSIVQCSSGINKVGEPLVFQCIAATLVTGITRNTISLAVDLVIFILPLRIVLKLKLPLHKKIELVVVFFTGFSGIIAGAVSLYFQSAQTSEQSANFINALLSTVIECCVIVIVSCAPALRVFWTHYLSLLPIFRHILPRNPSSLQRQTQDRVEGSTLKGSGHIHVTTHNYIELNDLPRNERPGYRATISHS